MKKSIISLLFILAVCVFPANMVFAQSTVGTPIVGIPVGLEGDPGSIIIARATTDVNGKFACKLPEGKYKLVLSYDQIKRILSAKDRNYASNPDGYVIESFFDVFVEKSTSEMTIFDRWGNRVKASTKLIIDRESGVIKLTVAKGSGTLSGTLTYTANKIVIPNTKK